VVLLVCFTGRTEMFSYQTPTIADIADAIVSDYGSLHINPMPVVRHSEYNYS